MPTKPVAEHLFDVVDGTAVLLGGKCRTCGAVAFPRPGACARCTGEDIVEHRLATEGTLWTFTVQSFPLKPPCFSLPSIAVSSAELLTHYLMVLR